MNFLHTHYDGGMDYQFSKFLDFNVPDGKHYRYTDMSKSTNHFGMKNNCSLLPFIYQHEFGFLHANVVVDKYLHYLRVKMLYINKLDNLPNTKLYSNKYNASQKYFYYKDDMIYFKPALLYNFICR